MLEPLDARIHFEVAKLTVATRPNSDWSFAVIAANLIYEGPAGATSFSPSRDGELASRVRREPPVGTRPTATLERHGHTLWAIAR